MENQIRHPHTLDFMRRVNGLDEYVCKLCCEVFYQISEVE